MMTKKILFLHGFFASGSCTSAQALRQAFVGKAEVLTPDLPLHPNEALEFIEDICNFIMDGNCDIMQVSAQIVYRRLPPIIPFLLFFTLRFNGITYPFKLS